ncbi:MAG: glycosyltransferase family 4 protein [Hyphomonadaceae bacterium]|nr:glycosyltransferase family 4 protein [Hyphomonadaceae bacterium]
MSNNRVAILYHFMAPDDVVSAVILHGLAEDLVAQGWEVEALPSNRACHRRGAAYPKREVIDGVRYKRIWRPDFPQKSFFGRLANSIWMILSWSLIGLRAKDKRPGTVIIGTDPMFGAFSAVLLKWVAKDIRILHWCFDVHPEAAIVQGKVARGGVLATLTERLMRNAYKSCDLMVDIGPCMRRLLQTYGHDKPELELTPWALSEPDAPLSVDARVRQELFGDAKLGLLYSGSFGEAHSHEDLLALARSLRGDEDIHFCFAVRGNAVDDLQAAVTPDDTNISFAGFARLEDLEKRLGAADIHLACLNANWSGIAVPSKFFGSLSVGRPVLFAGPKDSAIGNWITSSKTGWVLGAGNVDAVASDLRAMAKDKTALLKMQAEAHALYQKQFSRRTITKGWHDAIASMQGAEARARAGRQAGIETSGSELVYDAL